MDAAKIRKRILSSAIEVFAEKGRHRARMEDIASRAAVSRSLVYRNYPTKSHLFRDVLGVVVEEVLRKIENAAGPLDGSVDSAQTMRKVADASLDMFSQSPDLAKIALDAMVNSAEELVSVARDVRSRLGGPRMAALETLLEDVVARGAKRGLPGVDPEHLLTAVISMNLTYLFARPIAEVFLGLKIADEAVFLDETKGNVIDLWTHGICRSDSRDG